MRYVLSKLNDEQLKELLSCLQTSILIEPIIQAPNNFKNLPRGFRITKLTLNQLTKIYFEEIKKDYEGCLAKYISNYIEQKFNDIGITELFESTLNEFLLINAIEKIIIKNKISIPSYLILALEGITTNDEKFLAAKEVHLLLMEENQRAYSLGKENGLKEGEKNFDNILSSERRRADHAEKEVQRYKKVVEDLQERILNEKGKNTKIRKEKEEIEKRAKQNDSENLILHTNINELQDSIANYKKEISAMEDKISRCKVDEGKLSNELLSIKSEYLNLQEELSKEQIAANELRESILYLERRCFSDRIIKELCSDVVLDIQVDNIGKEEIIKYAHLIFDQDLEITDAWDKLSLKNNELLGKVINMMKENSVVGDDISILDEVENGIYLKFLILKCLKVFFYKILEIKEIETSISQPFIKRECH